MEGELVVGGYRLYKELSGSMDPCPFCGCRGGAIATSPDHSTAWGKCSVCDSRGPYVIVIKEDLQGSLVKAVNMWNTRKTRGD